MFCTYLLDKLAVDYENRILLFDEDNLFIRSGAVQSVKSRGFEVIEYTEPLTFRYYYEARLRDNKDSKVVIHVRDTAIFVPYDIRKRFYNVSIDYVKLFPKLDALVLRKARHIDLDLLYVAYQNYFGDNLGAKGTMDFIRKRMFEEANANEFVDLLSTKIKKQIRRESLNYKDWLDVAKNWGKIRMLVDGGYAVRDIHELSQEINKAFKLWMFQHYHQLSASPNVDGPVIVHKINDYMRTRSQKIALILIDGMSVENWLTILAHVGDFDYNIEDGCCFAFVPSVTAISRQSVFSGKLPVSHSDPFSLKNEEKQWVEYWTENGYKANEIYFGKGMEVDIPYYIKIAGIVINFIDDLMHGQIQGQKGMYRDIASWARDGEFKRFVGGLIKRGFDVYVASDHGNVEAHGQGKPKNEGLLTEMTSLRARIYHDFAVTDKVEENFKAFKYPGIYLPKDFQYIVCEENTAFGTKGKSYVCHGGMSIEEVIVPFIRIKDVTS
ncbi:MAG: BREX-3 system phosphatase PglZ [Firmicutes bacterium]|nr:BREX-3 system phosphatase PglZ [Bacillota bacterium]